MDSVNDLISVIVPVFNVEDYLDVCVGSIVNQTCRNLEIILVNDGSTDNSPELCDRWALKDCRIKVIHQENRGLSIARNRGIAAASGDFIGFVDSDDWLDEDFYGRLRSLMSAYEADIAAAVVVKEYKNGKSQIPAQTATVFNTEEAMKTLIVGDTFTVMAPNKLFRRGLLAADVFPAGRAHEDEFAMFRLFSASHKLVFCHEVFYHYRQRKSGIIKSGLGFRIEDKYASHFYNAELIREKYPGLAWMMEWRLMQFTLDDFSELMKEKGSACEALKRKVLEYRREVRFSVNDLTKLSGKQLIKLVLYVLAFTMLCRRKLRYMEVTASKKELFE